MTDINEKARLKWFSFQILEKELNLGNFDEKLIIQKAVYLTQKMGINFKYDFGWYLRGVYSSSLTVDMYEIGDIDLRYSPLEEEEKIVNRLLSIKDFIGTMSNTFELVSSIVYARVDRYMEEDERIIKFIKSVKPWFSDSEIYKAIDAMERLRIKVKLLA